MPRLKSLWLSLTALCVGCGGPFPQSTLAPKSDFSAAVDALFTDIFWWAVVVFVIVEGLLVYAIVRYRARRGAPEPTPVHGHTALEIGWTLAPALILVFIAVPTMRTIFATSGHAPDAALRVEVVGHQWWWEYRYPALGITAVNELHLPAGSPVRLDLTSADVIHSFWVPALGGKRDLTPGRTTRIAFRADSAGEYWGQCAEFCGASHANMRLRVFVEPAAEFDAWVAQQRAAPAAPPRGSLAERGRQVFARGACTGCHAITGVSRGAIGPDLTHVGGRSTIAGAMFPNTGEYLRRWIADAPSLKPGAQMPPQGLSADDLAAVVAYLQSLR